MTVPLTKFNYELFEVVSHKLLRLVDAFGFEEIKKVVESLVVDSDSVLAQVAGTAIEDIALFCFAEIHFCPPSPFSLRRILKEGKNL